MQAHEEEDDFADLGGLFGVERVNHGDPKHDFLWQPPREQPHSLHEGSTHDVGSPAAGPLRLHLANSSVDLMAHYVWQSSITLANLLFTDPMLRSLVQGRNVVELGAGAALPSLACALVGASRVIATDYPAPEVVANMKRNVRGNAESYPVIAERCLVVGHDWGTSVDPILGRAGSPGVDAVILADCLWLDHLHGQLIRSVCDLLCCARHGRAIVSYMHHDNAASVAPRFFERALAAGLHVCAESEHEWRSPGDEVDLDDPDEYTNVFVKVLEYRPGHA